METHFVVTPELRPLPRCIKTSFSMWSSGLRKKTTSQLGSVHIDANILILGRGFPYEAHGGRSGVFSLCYDYLAAWLFPSPAHSLALHSVVRHVVANRDIHGSIKYGPIRVLFFNRELHVWIMDHYFRPLSESYNYQYLTAMANHRSLFNGLALQIIVL